MDERFYDQHWTNKIEFRFEAAHHLPRHEGKCARLHGHSFVGHVYVRGDKLHDSGPSSGMLMDFQTMKRIIRRLVDAKLDHWHLNATTGLENPTSEELALWVFSELFGLLPGLYAVEIAETCTTSSTFVWHDTPEAFIAFMGCRQALAIWQDKTLRA